MATRANGIRVQGLVKRFGTVVAVDGASIEIRPGEIYGLLGPNGAGKSTLLRCITGLLKPDKGSIDVSGRDPLSHPAEVKAIVGFVPEEPDVFRSMTPARLLSLVASVRQLDPVAATRRARDLLKVLDAVKYYKTPIAALSKGNQQKIQIVAALLHDPAVLVLDEPLTGLDVRARRVVKDMLVTMAIGGSAIVLSTHVIDEAESICNRIGIISNGKLVAEGSVEKLRDRARHEGKGLEGLFLSLTGDEAIVTAASKKFKALQGLPPGGVG
ncbi:MAG: ABC transporter ATP-binding protein [Candidatus Lokiarchaeota archaeon]|nr:ABC transporter ATP-binding protein [Candidatus Lokiarchaeota archaeon]